MIMEIKMDYEFDEGIGPVHLLVGANFTPPRPAPPCSNPDDPAFSDPGDGAEWDILSVKFEGTGGHVADMHWKRNDKFDEAVGEALIENWESTR